MTSVLRAKRGKLSRLRPTERRLRLEALEDRALLALTADILDIVPDPRTVPVGVVTIVFSDNGIAAPVTGVDRLDFHLTRDGNNVPLDTALLAGGPAAYTLDLSSVTLAPGTYELRLVAGQSGIVEVANPLFGLEADAFDVFVIDSGAPTVTIGAITPNPRTTPVGPVAITFSEPVTGVNIGDFVLTRNGVQVDITGLVVTGSGTTRTIDLTSVTGLSGSYVFTLQAGNSGIVDEAGNALTSDAQVAWVADVGGPIATIQPITPNPRSTPVGIVTITFDEAVTGVNITDFRLTRNGAVVTLTGLVVNGSGTLYTLDLTTVSSTAGTYVLTLLAAGSGIVDALGNPLTTDATAAWVTDTTTPTATISPVTPNPRTTPVGIVTITFNEPVTGVNITDFTLTRNGTPVSLAGLTVNGGPTVYTIDLTSVTQVFGSYTLTLVAAGSGIVDAAGNPLTANATISFSIDDRFEDNDIMFRPTDLGRLSGPVTLTGLGLVDGTDWYRFTTSSVGSATDNVTITFDSAQGDLDLELYSVAGQRLAASTGTGNTETFSLSGRPAGTYYVRVFGKAGAINPSYTLSINQPLDTAFNILMNFAGLTASQITVFQQAAARWQSIIVSDLPAALYTGAGPANSQLVDDLLIDASAIPIDGVGTILGQSISDSFRTGSGLPVHGRMQFDTADLAALEATGALQAVVEHEMAHVLGLGTLWASKGLLVGAGTANVGYTGPRALAEYNAVFGLAATSIPVENTGGPGTADSHWRETVLGTELMTGYYNGGVANPLSRITIAALGDLGYTVSFAAADIYVKPVNSTLSGAPLLVSSTPVGDGQSVLKLAPDTSQSVGGPSSGRHGAGVALGPAPVFPGSGVQQSAGTFTGLSNQMQPLDVSNDGVVSPGDALLVINLLNDPASFSLDPNKGQAEGDSAAPYYDTSGDGLVTPLDALLIINYLNSTVPTAEGEAPGSGAYQAVGAAEVALLLQLIGPDVAASTTKRR